VQGFLSWLLSQAHAQTTSSRSYVSLIVITVNSSQSTKDHPPRHVAIIMDGNGRWAKERGLPRIEGHRRGAEAVKRTIKAAKDNGVEIITLYAFSVENWNRPKAEVDALMKLLDRFVAKQLPELIKRKIRLRIVGRYQELPVNVQSRLTNAEKATAHFTEHTLALAINYGSRTEVMDAVKAVAQAAQAGDIDPSKLDYDDFRQYLNTRDLPDPDLVIRTSGEARLSNFLLLQAAYAEIYFTPVLWPDFDESHFKAALNDYAARERRYGKTAEQLQDCQS
jgi:undecaprenyl diphosphate synthase